ncbi:MAG: DNA polymerase IV [Planctomycetota bacterium]
MDAPRTILHADMDAFYAAIEQRDRPELRGKPVIVGGMGRRGVVSTASYEARRFGVHSALPRAVARRRCPEGVFVAPRMDVYARVGAQVRAIFTEFTPIVEPLSLDEAFLDVSGSLALHGDGVTVARAIKARVRDVTGLAVSVGVASTKFVAKVASDLDKPDGLVVVAPGQEEAFLAPLPVARLWGAGPVTQQRMRGAGIETIGDLRALLPDRLVELFGEAGGRHFHRLARGLDTRPVESDRDARSISQETTFAYDLRGRDRSHAVLLRLSEGVGRRLRAEKLRAGVVRIKVRFPPFVTRTRQVKLPAPSDQDLVLHEAAVHLFDALIADREPMIRLLGVGAAELVEHGRPVQLGLFGAPQAGRVDAAVDAIRARFGRDAIRRGSVGRRGEGPGAAPGDR